MNTSSRANLRCRLCLCLCNAQELVAVVFTDLHGPLQGFAQETSNCKGKIIETIFISLGLSTIGFSPQDASESTQVCCNCFTMWNMMQDFLNICLKANEVLTANEQMALRKSWVASDDEKNMFISVCRVVKRHYYSMDKLLSTLKPPPFLSTSFQKKTVKVKEPVFRTGTVSNNSQVTI